MTDRAPQVAAEGDVGRVIVTDEAVEKDLKAMEEGEGALIAEEF
jgi:hypothetical protein